MKKIALVFVAVFLVVSGFAQKTADLGIWGGSSTYFGDIKVDSPFQTFNPNFGAFFRYNFNPRVGLRAQFITGQFESQGTIEGIPWSFEKNVQDLSLQVEINYLRYFLGDRKTPFSPYVLGGIGVTYFPYELNPAMINTFNPDHNKGLNTIEESVIALAVPFGFGVKTHLGERFGVAIEYLMRKSMADKLDNLDDPYAYINDKSEEIFYNDSLHNNDWMGYLGINLTYKINLNSIPCPAYDSKN